MASPFSTKFSTNSCELPEYGGLHVENVWKTICRLCNGHASFAKSGDLSCVWHYLFCSIVSALLGIRKTRNKGSTMPFKLTTAWKTDIGREREYNEDQAFAAITENSETGLFIVADGMGGHQAGEVASRIAVAKIRDALKRYLVPLSDQPTVKLPPLSEQGTIRLNARDDDATLILNLRALVF